MIYRCYYNKVISIRMTTDIYSQQVINIPDVTLHSRDCADLNI